MRVGTITACFGMALVLISPGIGAIATVQTNAQDLLAVYDTANTDGAFGLTLPEAQAAVPVLTPAEFTQLDLNGDDVLSRHELILATLAGEFYTADQDQDYHISLSELLRVIQFYNSHGISCLALTEDGYNPYGGPQDCLRYASDTNADWVIDLSELLRVIQIYNTPAYYFCPDNDSEDGFCLGTAPETPPATDGTHVVLGYNDLGMHCMNQDFSEMMILPPYNNLRAQVIRRGEDPVIVASGVTVSYSIPGNTISSTKTNFWDYVQDLLGLTLAPDIGLGGFGLSGTMTTTGTNDWIATGIPVTPMMDTGEENAYPLSRILVKKNDVNVAFTQAVVPVSWEISCNLCHNTPGISVATDILRRHDSMHGTDLENSKPVFCGGCHAQAPLGTTGSPSLSSAMHSAHAPRMGMIDIDVSCYACHPGIRTRCQRDIHFSNGIQCTDCHGDMTDVGNPARRPWVDEPRCGSCHTRAGFEFEQPGTLFRDSKGHHGVHCSACHGSPHAITPTVTPNDNVQAIAVQGHAGVINTCSVCHNETPEDPFDHRLSEEEDDKSMGG
ncbi:MAG TPA: hypothetical protein PLI09_26530 [Candidatus Hydrogenedentes bacterium]|nr:hypothetical protein [Candidatus Hydrogenedentota bacterium]